LKIGIDARSLGIKICGVSRVTLSLINALGEVDKQNQYIIYTDTIREIPGLPANFSVVASGCNRMNALYDVRFYRLLLQDDLDMLHVMHSWLPLFIPSRVKKLVTIHDIFTVTDANFFCKRRPFHWIFRFYFLALTWMTANRTDVIITITNYCANELKQVFNLKHKRFEIVHNSPGIKPENGSEPRKALIDRDYLFYLGNFRSYKNVPILIKGYAHFLKSTGSHVDLVIAGNDDNTGIYELCALQGITDRVHFFARYSGVRIHNLVALD